jgi:hypothetical protein
MPPPPEARSSTLVAPEDAVAMTGLVMGDAPVAPPVDANPMSSFIGLVRRVLVDDELASALGEAGFRARIELINHPGGAVLVFDHVPPTVASSDDSADAEIVLWMRSSDLDVFWRRESSLPMKILAGEVTFTGPVRKLLRVLPVLREAAAGIAKDQ